MTREEAIEILKDLWRTKHSMYLEADIRKALEMAIQALEQEPKWIPVSERLPEDAEHVLVYFERDAWKNGKQFRKKDIDTGWQIEDWWHVDGCSGVVGIAWMPLPSPYKGEKK